MTEVSEVVRRIPSWTSARQISSEPLPGGLTNLNHLVTVDGEQFVLRLADPDAVVLGVDRAVEEQAMRRAAAAGIAPDVVAFLQPEGHTVTPYLGPNVELSFEEFTSPKMVPRVAALLRATHELGPIDGRFDPYADIWRWMHIVTDRGTPVPDRLAGRLAEVTAIEADRTPSGAPVLCHNDPYFRNFLHDGDVLRLIDWEYARMGDPMYDLAGVAYGLDGAGRELLLDGYFGRVTQDAYEDLTRMVTVFLTWNTVWSLVRAGSASVEHDYLAFAEEFLDLLE